MKIKELKKITTIETKDFVQMVRLAVENLNLHLDEVNDLNVFPVPDGDTGTNMKRTIETGYDVIKAYEKEPLYKAAQDLSKGMLLGARGNSGVILSQIFRGFSNGVGEKKYIGTSGLNSALKSAVKKAYSAVVKPVEGTILTVIREARKFAGQKLTVTPYVYLKNFVKQAEISLANTKELLDVLKEADVVDSGGAGLLYIFQGFVSYFEGKLPNPNYKKTEFNSNDESQREVTKPQELDFSLFNEYSELDYGYCTEFILQLSAAKVKDVNNFDEKEIIDYLNSVGGESIVCFKDGTVVKTHVHTKDPGAILSHVRTWGEFLTIKVENMALQHNNKIKNEETKAQKTKKVEHKFCATVAVAQGAGLVSTFKGLQVDEIVNGKQTMNPSTEDFLEAFRDIDADNIVVFPNNSNIVLTAEQARDMYKEEKPEVNVRVIKTKSIAQGYVAASMIQFLDNDLDGLLEEIEKDIKDIFSVEITTATRDTKVSGVEVKKNHFIGIVNHDLVADNKNRIECVIDTLSHIEDIKYKESILIFFGADATDTKEHEELKKAINKVYANLQVDIVEGDQDVYPYLAIVC